MKYKRIVTTTALATGLVLAPLAQPAFAQTTAPDAGATAVATAAPDTTTTTATQPQQNFNYGWLGLIGLIGLGGLMRRSTAATYVERS